MKWYVCETCDEDVPRVNEYGICPACHEWEIAQGWHQDDVSLDDIEAARGEAGKGKRE